VLFAVAGNDTTRHTSSHALRALTEFPDQRGLLMKTWRGGSPERWRKFVRYASPCSFSTA
jgi:cytochrome P450